MKTAQDKSARYLKSNFYEQLVEHAFISELLTIYHGVFSTPLIMGRNKILFLPKE
jgi:hypothetical protein